MLTEKQTDFIKTHGDHWKKFFEYEPKNLDLKPFEITIISLLEKSDFSLTEHQSIVRNPFSQTLLLNNEDFKTVLNELVLFWVSNYLKPKLEDTNAETVLATHITEYILYALIILNELEKLQKKFSDKDKMFDFFDAWNPTTSPSPTTDSNIQDIFQKVIKSIRAAVCSKALGWFPEYQVKINLKLQRLMPFGKNDAASTSARMDAEYQRELLPILQRVAQAYGDDSNKKQAFTDKVTNCKTGEACFLLIHTYVNEKHYLPYKTSSLVYLMLHALWKDKTTRELMFENTSDIQIHSNAGKAISEWKSKLRTEFRSENSTTPPRPASRSPETGAAPPVAT